MLGKEGLDLATVFDELFFEDCKHFDEAQSQAALGVGHRFGAAELSGAFKSGDAPRLGLRPVEFVAMQEVFPFAFAGCGQGLRSGKAFDEFPGFGMGPVIECFQGGGIVLVERGLQCVDQFGPLGDELLLITAKQAEFFGERIVGQEWFPGRTVRPQSQAQRVCVQAVGLLAAGRFALTIRFGAAWIDWINGEAAFQELFDGQAAAGFDGHGQARERLDLFAKKFPALERMVKGQFANDRTVRINNDDVVMIMRPVKAGEVGVVECRHRSF